MSAYEEIMLALRFFFDVEEDENVKRLSATTVTR